MRACTSTLACRVSALSLALLLSAGGATLAQDSTASEFERCPGDYIIGPEDVLDIAIWNSPEISRAVPVRPDGKISLPLVNDVQAAGLTPMQLRDTLSQTLAAYIATPIVSVIVREIHSFKVTVIGEVKTPGRYELKSRATVVDVLAMAGGPTDYATRSKILVLRQQAGSMRQIPFTLEKLSAKSAPLVNGSAEPGSVNVCLMPGDIVHVP
jgi:polysaccharide export outer membrane protein